MEAAHARWLHVHPYTLNEEQEMKALIELGVDGMFTNFPTGSASAQRTAKCRHNGLRRSLRHAGIVSRGYLKPSQRSIRICCLCLSGTSPRRRGYERQADLRYVS